MTETTTGSEAAPGRSLRWPVICVLAGTAAIVVGLVLFLTPSPAASFG